MIVNLVNVSGKGFMIFRKEFSFHLSDYVGMTVQIDGENKDDEKSRSNGSGKSTLLEAFHWGLFGELCRKSKYKDEVIHKKERKARVTIKFRIDPHVYLVERTIERKKTPNLEVYMDTKELWIGATYQTKQSELEKIIGMNSVSFQCASMFGRDFMNFPDLKPSERASILTEIRGLDKYLEGSRKAGESSKSVAIMLDELHVLLGNKEGRLTGIRSTSFKESINEFERIREGKILEKEELIFEIKKRIEKQEEDIRIKKENLEGRINAVVKQIEIHTESLSKLPSIEDLIVRLVELTGEDAKLKSQKNSFCILAGKIEKEIIDLRKRGVGDCPFCGQEIKEEYLASKITGMEGERWSILGEIENLEPLLKKLNEQIMEVQEQRNFVIQIKKTLPGLESTKYNLQKELAAIDVSEINKNENLITTHLTRIEEIKQEINPYVEMEQDRQSKIKQLGVEIRDINGRKIILRENKNYFDYWIEGFKKIRMMIFDSMISQLEDLAQFYLSQYSSELNIIMTTARETRSGTIKDEFHIAIIDANGDEISYDMYSGGERQKIRLSISRALAQFIKDNCGVDFNFIAFDEPNDALDDVGKDANFDTFWKLAEEGKAVLVTDHDAMFKDKFDHNILIIKENGESTIYA